MNRLLARRPPLQAANGDARGGYVLLSVLWICAGILILAAGVADVTQRGLGTSRNRAALVQAEWKARGCIERTRAELALPTYEDPATVPGGLSHHWVRLDRVILSKMEGSECSLDVRPTGAGLDVNRVDLEQTRRLLGLLGARPGLADSVAAALIDARDPDDVPVEGGAEAAWYVERGLSPPPDRPFLTMDEVQSVRGVEEVPALLAHLTLDPGPVSLAHAPAAVLTTLPGFSREAAIDIANASARGITFGSFTDIADLLRPEDQLPFNEAIPHLMAIASIAPASWVVVATSTSGNPSLGVSVEVRVGLQNGRIRLEGTRIWTP